MLLLDTSSCADKTEEEPAATVAVEDLAVAISGLSGEVEGEGEWEGEGADQVTPLRVLLLLLFVAAAPPRVRPDDITTATP